MCMSPLNSLHISPSSLYIHSILFVLVHLSLYLHTTLFILVHLSISLYTYHPIVPVHISLPLYTYHPFISVHLPLPLYTHVCSLSISLFLSLENSCPLNLTGLHNIGKKDSLVKYYVICTGCITPS